VISAVYSGNTNFQGSSTPSGQAGTIATVAGGGVGDNSAATNASLNHPLGVAVDGSGNLFIVDNYHERVREVNAATGVITTVAGTANVGMINGGGWYGGDGGPATAAGLNNPVGVAVDGNGDLFIADRNNNRIRDVNLSTGVISTLAGDGT
jgi:hypothetical protein